MGNPVIWFEIYVQDMARAKKFYEAVFNKKLEKLSSPVDSCEMWAFPMDMDSVGAAGSLVKMDGVKPGGSTLVYFASADCSEAAAIKKAGGKIDKEKMSIGQYGFIVLAYDTEGNMFGLHSLK